MVTNYYNASNGFQSPVRREPKPYCAPQTKDECAHCGEENKAVPAVKQRDRVCRVEKPKIGEDTLLILGVLLLLFTAGCEDTLLLLALLYLLLF